MELNPLDPTKEEVITELSSILKGMEDGTDKLFDTSSKEYILFKKVLNTLTSEKQDG